MADNNITQILAALAAQKGDNPGQAAPMMSQNQPYQQPYGVPTPPNNTGGYPLPQPSSSGSFDLSNIKPANSGSMSLGSDKRGPYDQGRGTPRDGRSFRSRSRSRSPTRGYRDSYNPYRDERREDAHRSNGRRDRSVSPGRRHTDQYSRGGFPSQDYGPDSNMETIMIDSGLVGLIIGRSGENLRRVENDTNTRVQFMTGPESGGPHRLCKITGPRHARESAKNEINRIIAENGKTGRVMSADRPPPPTKTPSNQQSSKGGGGGGAGGSGEEAIQIMVPDRTVGLIIGRGGETIRDLQERSGCHVNIMSEDKSINGLRPVNLIGNQASAKIAKDLIMEIVDSDNKGLASGMAQGTGANATARGGGGGGGGGSGGGGGGGGEDKISDTLIVPSDAVGMIIGKGGETIKDMQIVTGCKINIPQWSGNGPDIERVTGLIGSRAAIEHAKRAIMEKVRAVEDKNRSNSRQQQGQDQYNRGSPPQSANPTGYPSGGYPGQAQAGYGAQPQGEQASAAGGADPYAAYGGYQNYVNMWYAALGQQQGGAQPGSGPPPS